MKGFKLMRIQIMFEGLMIFHQNTRTNFWEVGILPDDMHHLQISGAWMMGTDQIKQYVDKWRKWSLEIVSQPSTPPFPHTGVTPKGERQVDRLHPAGLDAIGWLLDIERELHKGHLEIKPDFLRPIISLASGTLSTRCLTDGIQCQQGEGEWVNFGCISEIMMLEIDINPGQELILKGKSEQAEEEICKLPYAAGGTRQIAITNTPDPDMKDDPSHFKRYYNAFPAVKDSEQFNFFRPIRNGNEEEPVVPSPNSCSSAIEVEWRFAPSPFICGGILTTPSDGVLP